MEHNNTKSIYFKIILLIAITLHTLIFFYYSSLIQWNIGVLEVFFGIVLANAPVWSIYLWYRNTSNEQLPPVLKVIAYFFHFIASISGLLFYTYAHFLGFDAFTVYMVIPLIQIILFWVLTAILIWFSVLV